MRYYRIEIEVGSGLVFTSYANGRTLPGALNVEFDIPVLPYGTPSGDAYIKIWGIGLGDIAQAKDLNFKKIRVFGGFQAGLPLANPSQSGLLVSGYIYQAFGNWIGVEQSLDIVIKTGSPPTSSKLRSQPINLTTDCRKGDTLQNAITNTLKTAYPNFTTTFSISDKLVAQEAITDRKSEIVAYSLFMNEKSRSIINDANYQGVSILAREDSFVIYDGTASGNTSEKEIAFKDMIGQPTWIQPLTVQFKCPMRADLKIPDKIRFPEAQVITGVQAASSLINHKLTFQGKFQISVVRHVGSFRQATADAWVTVFNAFSEQPVGATQ